MPEKMPLVGDSPDANDPIPETVAEALKQWDAGETIFSLEMGGIGPGYEMAIHGLAFELMREIDSRQFLDWEDEEAVAALDAALDAIAHSCNSEPWGGFSGAQVGAAKNIAAYVCRRGYRQAMREPDFADRLIQVSKKDLRS